MQGNRQLSTGQSATGAQNFAIDAALRKMYTMLPVKVVSVEQAVPTDQVGYVDVVPLIRQVDGEGNAVDTSTLYRLPFFRFQAGANAVIVNPQPGDKGAALFAMRDISVLKSTRDGPVQPGTRRFFAAGDGYYLGGWLNDAPDRYVMIDDQGVTIEGVAKIEMHGADTTINAESSCTINAAGGCTINGDVLINGSLTWTGTAQGKNGARARFSGGWENTGGSVTSNGITLETHTHGGVEPGGGSTGGPQ